MGKLFFFFAHSLERVITREWGIFQDLFFDGASVRLSICFCHRYSGARLEEIGERFCMSDAAETEAIRRVKISSESDDPAIRELLGRVEKRCRDVCG